MSNLQVVDADVLEADLTSVADSIRAKTGGEEKLAFPSGYMSALDTIESADSALAEIEYKLSNGYTNYSYMFHKMIQMTEVPMGVLQHISNGENFANMYNGCRLTIIPPMDTSNGKDFSGMLAQNAYLVTVGGINLTNATSINYMVSNCSNLTNLTFNGVIKITGLDLSPCSKLTHDSLMSAINALYDHKTAGSTGRFTLKLGSTNLAKLTDAEKAIATQRGWTLA